MPKKATRKAPVSARPKKVPAIRRGRAKSNARRGGKVAPKSAVIGQPPAVAQSPPTKPGDIQWLADTLRVATIPEEEDEGLCNAMELVIEKLGTLKCRTGEIRVPLFMTTISCIRLLNTRAVAGDRMALFSILIAILDGVAGLNGYVRKNPDAARHLAEKYRGWPVIVEDTTASLQAARKLLKKLGVGKTLPYRNLKIYGEQSRAFLDWLRQNHGKVGRLSDWPDIDPANAETVKRYVEKYQEDHPCPQKMPPGEYRKDVKDSVEAVFRQIRSASKTLGPEPDGVTSGGNPPHRSHS